MFAVAKHAAVLRIRKDAPPELLEAFAALLSLLGVSGPAEVTNRMAGLASEQSGLDAKVRVALDGHISSRMSNSSRTGLAKSFR
jgi:hypothetical protein